MPDTTKLTRKRAPYRAAKGARIGRPTDLTPERQEAICKAVRDGNFLSAAARASGISPKTFYEWMRRGQEEASGPYVAFREAVKRAERESEAALVAEWRAHTTKNWMAAAALLERRFPKRWLRRQQVDMHASVKVEDARDVLLAKLEKIAAQQATSALEGTLVVPSLPAGSSPEE